MTEARRIRTTNADPLNSWKLPIGHDMPRAAAEPDASEKSTSTHSGQGGSRQGGGGRLPVSDSPISAES